MITVECIHQAVLQHGIDEFDVAHLRAATHMRQMRRHRHGFHAAGDDDLRIAVGDLLQAESHRPQARTAKLIHAPRRLVLRNAGSHGSLPRGILPLAAGQHLTQDDFVDVFRRKLGAFECPLDRQRTEFMGEQRTKCTIEGSYRRPRSGHNYYVSHDQLPVQSHVLAASSHLRRPIVKALWLLSPQSRNQPGQRRDRAQHAACPDQVHPPTRPRPRRQRRCRRDL